MTIYQALQLNAAGSKNLIQNTNNQKEKRKWKLIYLLKVLLTVGFCAIFVTLFSLIFGAENSITGVAVLLTLLTFRQADFGIKTSHGVITLIFIFTVLTFGPYVSNRLSPIPAFLLNICCIFGMVLAGCHNVIMSNQSTFVLNYLLLMGYDIEKSGLPLRIAALSAGCLICCLVFWKTHRNRTYKRTLKDVLLEFDLNSHRTLWQIRFTLAVSSSLLFANLLGLPRAMWIGISVMSLMVPFYQDTVTRAKRRAPFNIIGCILFLLLYYFLPKSIYPYIGIIGGIGVGFSASYSWQTIFNVFGALYAAVGIFGLVPAILLRIGTNAYGTLHALVFSKLFDRIHRNKSEVCLTR